METPLQIVGCILGMRVYANDDVASRRPDRAVKTHRRSSPSVIHDPEARVNRLHAVKNLPCTVVRHAVGHDNLKASGNVIPGEDALEARLYVIDLVAARDDDRGAEFR
jgi:hypothetical protein